MKSTQRFLQAFALAAGFALALLSSPVDAQLSGKDLVLRNDAKCTKCHDDPQLLTLGQRRHGTTADGRTPSCTNCHGESEAHTGKPSEVHPDVVFAGANASAPAARNESCLNCHQTNAKRSHWAGSTHERNDVACTNCHQVHSAHDAVQDKRTQFDVCFACHKEQRTQVGKPSHHPVLEGKVACSDCHNPHGSVGPKLMKRDSVNDTCYTCHMEKRGPFVHSHAPVTEDCGLCHNPHGTTAESLLKARPPFLCHECHTPHGGQVAQLVGQGQTTTQLSPTTSGKSGINYTMARGCLNCHTQVHGSNNPSTNNPTPQFMFR